MVWALVGFALAQEAEEAAEEEALQTPEEAVETPFEAPIYELPEVEDIEGVLIDPTCEADQVLLEALLLFLTDERGVEGAARLGGAGR